MEMTSDGAESAGLTVGRVRTAKKKTKKNIQIGCVAYVPDINPKTIWQSIERSYEHKHTQKQQINKLIKKTECIPELRPRILRQAYQ